MKSNRDSDKYMIYSQTLKLNGTYEVPDNTFHFHESICLDRHNNVI